MIWRRLIICAVLFGGLLALPFYFRKHDGIPPVENDAETLVIVTAHNKSVRDEYEIAFRKHYKAKYGRDIILDFRSPGGTSDIVRYIEDRFTAEFRNYWNRSGRSWDGKYADIFRDPAAAVLNGQTKHTPSAAQGCLDGSTLWRKLNYLACG